MAQNELQQLIEDTYLDKEKNSPEEFFHRTLYQLGFSYALRGTEYLKELLIIAYQYPGSVYDVPIVKSYETIGAHYQVKAHAIERSIRHSIQNAWDHGNVSLQSELFAYCVDPDKGRPSTKEFVCLIVNLYKRNLKA